jgi:hypothetical protein
MASPSSIVDVCRFNTTAGGVADWTYSSAVLGYQSPSAAKMVNGGQYSYRAESADLSQWEIGTGIYNSATGVLTRAVVLFNSAGTTAKINFSAAPQVAIVALGEDLIFGKNRVINGGFWINQRGYVSGAALAAGAYGHDRWKGGASGGDYSFAQGTAPTTVTIAAGKSLIQVVEGVNVEGGTYTLSWSGSAVARIGVNSATPSGNFAASPITVTGQTAGAVMSIEFTGANAAGGTALATNTGTMGAVQLETGAKATPFEIRMYSAELQLCQRYCFVLGTGIGANQYVNLGYCFSSTIFRTAFVFPVIMRAAPTGSYSALSDFNADNGVGGPFTVTSISFTNYVSGAQVQVNFASGLTASVAAFLQTTSANARLRFDAEL